MQLIALYSVSDVGFCASLREGITLTAHEFVAAQQTHVLYAHTHIQLGMISLCLQLENTGSSYGPGVLVYSEFAGCASAMGTSLKVNPHDARQERLIISPSPILKAV